MQFLAVGRLTAPGAAWGSPAWARPPPSSDRQETPRKACAAWARKSRRDGSSRRLTAWLMAGSGGGKGWMARLAHEEEFVGVEQRPGDVGDGLLAAGRGVLHHHAELLVARLAGEDHQEQRPHLVGR